MLVARVLYPVTALGPGQRIGIWVCGCKRRCHHCANPELQAFDMSRKIAVDDLMKMVVSICRQQPVDGFTISGGEPFEQAEELCELVSGLRQFSEDVLVFSGYTLQELRARKDTWTDSVVDSIAVLIDGEYVEEQNTGSVLRGSDNQVMHILNEDVQKTYAKYLDGKRQFQNFATTEGIFSVGLHYQGFTEDIQKRLHEKVNG